MKRWTIRICVFLLLLVVGGAIVNVAVAWAACSEVTRWSDGLDCMLEQGMYDDKLPKSRYEGAGICIDHTPCRSRISFMYANYTGGWRDVPDLDAEVPRWADAFLNENALAELRRHDSQECLIEAAGWPFLAISGCVTIGTRKANTAIKNDWSLTLPHRSNPWTGYSGDLRALPLCPIWPGFALNTLFYAAILWGLFAAPGTVRRWRRRRRGLCPKCAYPVGTSDACTECGRLLRSS